MDDTVYSVWIVILTLIVPGIVGLSLGGFAMGLSGLFVSLICLPVILFFLAISLYGKRDDIYG